MPLYVLSAFQNTRLEIGSDITPDFNLLPREWMADTIVSSETEKAEVEAKLCLRVEKLTKQLLHSAPNLKASDQYHQIKDQETAQSEMLEAERQKDAEILNAFQQIHRQRYDTFMEAFHHVSSKIDKIYKDLTKSEIHPCGGSAALYVESHEEAPFLHGIKFTAIPPGKRYREMDQLSGGEKTVIALALLFAMHSYKPCPFFILDEIDASLDAVSERLCASS